MKSKATVFFSTLNSREQDVAVITRAIGLDPTRVNVRSTQDDAAPFGVSEVHLWEFTSPLPESSHVHDHIQALLEVLLPRADAVRSVAERFEASIHCQLTYYDSYPGLPTIQLWRPIIESLDRLAVHITFDLFFLPDPPPGT